LQLDSQLRRKAPYPREELAQRGNLNPGVKYPRYTEHRVERKVIEKLLYVSLRLATRETESGDDS
jgi:hypothetical protein